MTSIDTIPLNKLSPWPGNVRKTNADTGLGELSASIAAHGLLQSLVVRKDRKGKYAVVAGRRRFMALNALAKAGTISSDMPVPCQIIGGETNATEISLVENAVRTPMHPADEFDAFRELIEGGMQTADIAARFGVTETVVQQRLKLARVSPVILASYRKDKIGLAHVMAFAVSDDHAAQEHVWKELSDWQLDDPDNIRAALTEHEVTARDYRVKFVTLKSYEKAGGAVRRDLFAQDEDGVFIEDIVLLESLVAKKLEKAAAAVRKQGWKWVEIRPSFDYSEWSKCERRYAEAPPLSEEEQAELDALSKEQDDLYEGDDENPRLEEVTQRIDELDDREKSWPADAMAIAGAVVTIGGDGKADIHYGYVKPEDAPKKERKPVSGSGDDDAAAATEGEAPALSAALTEGLTGHRTAATAAALAGDAAIALAAVVHGMTLQLFYNGRARDTCLHITVSQTALREVEGTGVDALALAKTQWGDRLPGDPEDLLAWCLEQSQQTLLDLLACCAALTVDAVRTKSDRADDERLIHADRMAAALSLDMAAWFKPTAANYFSRIGKDAILAALQEAKGATAPAWAKMKKSELAALAERELADSGWLPDLLKRSA